MKFFNLFQRAQYPDMTWDWETGLERQADYNSAKNSQDRMSPV